MLDFLYKVFDVRRGELKVTLLLQGYIFLVVTTLLIIKPAVNALFISELGPDNLPPAYLLVAVVAVVSSYLYTRATALYDIRRIIFATLTICILLFVTLGALLHLNLVSQPVLYFFYAIVAIYAVLATSQFWMIANLVFNVREAKRLFGLIGAGAIVGGIFGGYLTTLLTPIIGGENLFFLAALFLVFCLPIPGVLWKVKLKDLNLYRQKKRQAAPVDNPLKLIRSSRHLTLIAAIVATGVLVARLVDYQFSSFAVAKISDTDELTSFFGFWLSTFNLLSLALQLFLTRRIVGIWGVGISLMLLPVLIFFGGFLFIIIPELWVVTLVKGIDASFKQSLNKSAVELIALPLPISLKKKTKAFIDVVVDSLATGLAGIVLILFINAADVSSYFISLLIILLTLVWLAFVVRIRKEYFLLFRENLDKLKTKKRRKTKPDNRESVLEGMRRVLAGDEEDEILYMLGKVREINDNRLAQQVLALLSHSSDEVKIAAIRNLYFFNSSTIAMEVMPLLKSENDGVIKAVLDYLLLHADNHEEIVFDTYLDHSRQQVAGAALLCLATEARDNKALADRYGLSKRIADKIAATDLEANHSDYLKILEVIGLANDPVYYEYIAEALNSDNKDIRLTAIGAAGSSMSDRFIDHLLLLLGDKNYRLPAINALLKYDRLIIPQLAEGIADQDIALEVRSYISRVIAGFNSQESVSVLISLFISLEELPLRLACLKELVALKQQNPLLVFDKKKIARLILEECKLYDQTIYAMHTQIIVQYLKRKKYKKTVTEAETEARDSLMELLERRLESSLERIFKLLELRYPGKDIEHAYKGLISDEDERRSNAIEFLDILLNKSLKDALIPIIESTTPDTSSEDFVERINHNLYTESECFEMLLNGKDRKLKLAVLYLIGQQTEKTYRELVIPWINDDDRKVRDFARGALEKLESLQDSH